MTTPSAPPTTEEAHYAQELIRQERITLRVGVTTLSVLLSISTLVALLFALFLGKALGFERVALPAVVIIGLLAFLSGRRIWRLVRASSQARTFWRDGKLSTGELAIDVARRQLAES